MFKKFILTGVLLLVLAGSVATAQAQLSQLPEQAPTGPITRDQAIGIAMAGAQSWGEQNAHLVDVRKQSRNNFIGQLKAQGDDVLLAGTGDVWIVDLSGKFTPNRVEPGTILQCNAMFIVIDIDSGDVISAGCR